MKKAVLLILALSGLARADVTVNPEQFDNLSGKVHRGDLGRSGVFNASGVTNLPQQRWKFQTGAEVKSSPVVVNGIAYFGSLDGCVYAVDAATGSLVWSNQTGSRVWGSAAVVSNTVFIANESSWVYAFNATNGAQIWKSRAGTSLNAGSPAVAYGTVFIGGGSSGGGTRVLMTTSKIYAFDQSTGSTQWISDLTGPQGYAAIAMDTTNIYAGSASLNCAAFRVSNGTRIWASIMGHQNRQFMSMSVVDGQVYYPGTIRGSVSRHSQGGKSGASSNVWLNTTLDHNLAFDMNSGGLYGYEILTDLAIGSNRVYAGCNDGKLYTFDRSTGAKGWTFQTGGKVQSSPAIASNIVYFGSWDGKVYAVNATTGAEVWNYTLGERIISAPWPADGALYVGCDDGAVYCLEEGDGTGDADSDGLPDWWELQYFGNATAADPDAPAANTAYTVLECYQNSLDPTDPMAGDARIRITVTTNAVVQDVNRLGLCIGDSYHGAPMLKVRDTKNFEGSVYRQMVKGILTSSGIISYYGSSNQMASTGWLNLYPGMSFRVVSGPAKGTTGTVTGVTFSWQDIWNTGSSNFVPTFTFDRTLDLGTNSSIRDMGVLIEDLSRTGEGFIGTNSYRIVGDITPVSDNPPGVPGVSCARLNGTSAQAHIKLDTAYQSQADGNGNWNVHFWVKKESGNAGIKVHTLTDLTKFSTNFVPSNGWQKIELLIPVSVSNKVYPANGEHMFQITVTGGVARVDQIEVWKAGYTNTTAFTDDFVDHMRLLKPGVLRQVMMGGNTVSNWLLNAEARQAGTFRQDFAVGPYGNRSDPSVGYHELMGLCEEIDAEPWLCIPGGLHEDEVSFLVDYLAGPTNTAGGKMRADLGHSQPWTETLRNINVEFGNEAWNLVGFYNFAGFNGEDYWHDLIASGKGSPYYTNNIRFHAAGQNFAVSQTTRILNDATNADNYAIATYMIHDVATNLNWYFTQGDYETQFKWFLGYPMHKIFEDGMPQQWEAITSAAANAEFSQYEFNYHSALFDTSDPSYTNVMNDVNVFTPSVCHGISVVNSMLAEMKHYRMRTQCYFTHTGETAYDGARLFGSVFTYKKGEEKYRPVFYAKTMANRVLSGDLLQTVLNTNVPFASHGVFTNSTPETRYYDTVYTYAFRDGTSRGLILFNYDLEATQTVRLVLSDYVQGDAAQYTLLTAESYTNHNEADLISSPQVVPVTGTVSFASGTEVALPPFSMQVLEWQAQGELPQILVSTNLLDAPEGGSTNFTVQLTAQPEASVTVTVVRASGDTDISALPQTMVFTSGDWSSPQTVTVSAAEDADSDSSTAVIRCSSVGLPSVNVTVSEIENDQGIVLSTTALSVPENSNAVFNVKLSTVPASPMTVSVQRISGDTNITVSGGASLVFATTNWSVWQSVTLSADEDPDVENGQAVVECSMPGEASKQVTATEADNDTVGLVISPMFLTVSEGSTAAFTVKLSAIPPEGSTVQVSRVSGDTDLSIDSGATLVFGPGNWNVDQTVTLAAASDLDSSNGEAVFRCQPLFPNTTGSRDVLAVETDSGAQEVSFQEGASGYSGTVDSYLSSYSQDSNYGTSGNGYIEPTRKPVVAWDISSLAATNYIESAAIQVAVTRTSGGVNSNGFLMTVYALKKSWTEAGVTWNTTDGTTPWQTAGALGSEDRGVLVGTVSVPPPDEGIVYQLLINLNTNGLEYLRNAQTNPAANYGFIFDNETNTERRTFYLSETATVSNRPKLLLYATGSTNAQIVLAAQSVNVPEGSNATFGVGLTRSPGSPVTVTVARVSGDTDITVTSGASLQFTAANWSTWQYVTLSAAEDADWTNSTATIRCSSSGMADADVAATEQDNDGNPVYRLPWTETFENDGTNAGTLGALNGQRGWIASGAAVTNSQAQGGSTQSVQLASGSMSHSFSNGTSEAWITLWMKPAAGNTNSVFPAGASAVFHVNTNGTVTAWSNQTPVAVTATVSNDWNRFDVYCNYTSRVWKLSLNGSVLFNSFGFYSTNRSVFGELRIVNDAGTAARVDTLALYASEPSDTDSDGLPDEWENTYFGGLGANPGDTAANGINTVIECYVAGIDPTDSAARFALISLTPSLANNVLLWQGVSGRVYTVYWTSNLLNGFQILQSNVLWTGSIFTDAVHGVDNQGFYQIKVEVQ